MSAVENYTFNRIGVTLTPQSGSANFPGVTTVRRITGTPISTSNGNHGIGRYYEINPAQNSNLNVNMVFSYHEHELSSVDEAGLILFKAATINDAWVAQGQNSRDATANTVSLNGITGFSVWTLADQNNPLPVELISFDAKKVGSDAELSWATASEKNSRGFEVQVSTNGKEFYKLGFVESRNGNTLQKYSFSDTEKGKTGIRYYRLKQTDQDGTFAYYNVKTVRFEAEKLQLTAYQNPFEQEFDPNISAIETGKASLKLTDLTGKLIYEQTIDLKKGNNQLTVGLDSKLPAGVYLLQFHNNKEKTNTRLIKQ